MSKSKSGFSSIWKSPLFKLHVMFYHIYLPFMHEGIPGLLCNVGFRVEPHNGNALSRDWLNIVVEKFFTQHIRNVLGKSPSWRAFSE